jgi:hypothetical protein
MPLAHAHVRLLWGGGRSNQMNEPHLQTIANEPPRRVTLPPTSATAWMTHWTVWVTSSTGATSPR